MRSGKSMKRNLVLWALAGAAAAATPFMAPQSAFAADEEMKDVAESKVPAPVMVTARQEVLDSTEIVYRRNENGKKFTVNFTTPQNVRMIAHIREDGTLEEDAKPAPTQPKNAPKGEAREQLVTQWNARVLAAKTPVPPAPVAPAVIAALPPVPVTPVNTPITAADLPGAVVQSLDKLTAGSKDVRYFRQTGGPAVQYEADYTGADGGRREVIVADSGAVVSGPLVLRDGADDKDLAADRPANQAQAPQMQLITAADVPPAAKAVMDHYTVRSTDIRYRRDTYADKTVAYTTHWVLNDNGRRYFLTAKPDGSLLVQPRLSSTQPTSANDPDGVRSIAVKWADVPDKVKQTIQPLASKDKDATYYKQMREGDKVFYGAEYMDGGKKMWVRTDDAGKLAVGPVLYDTGRRPGDPVPAAGKVPADTTSGKTTTGAIPVAVQVSVAKHTLGGKDVVTTKGMEEGKAVYHVSWSDALGKHHDMRLDEKGDAIVNTPAK